MKKIVVAVSGGCDSMYLLHTLKHLDVVVAHVNYGVRQQAQKESELVESYCEKNNLVCEIVYAPKLNKGNFQANAREFRYAFFKQLCQKYQCNHIYVAHHLDDLIETYFLQKKRGSIPQYFGLKESVMHGKYCIHRPLLMKEKSEIIQCCKNENIPYLDDLSNYELKYERNHIRKAIQHLSKKEKLHIITEINELNKNKKDKFATLRKHLFENGVYHCSDKTLENITKFLDSGKGIYKLSNEKVMYPNGVIQKKNEYSYTFESLTCFACEYFKINLTGDVGGFYVREDDFPITVRNWKPQDKIKLAFGTKNVARFFVDKKIPHHERAVWPVVVNRNNEIIFVAKLGARNNVSCDKYNIYVVK